MYKKGELEIIGPPCDDYEDDDGPGICYGCGRSHKMGDAGTLFLKGVYLPHSCNEWVIGGPDEIRALIADLQAALEQI